MKPQLTPVFSQINGEPENNIVAIAEQKSATRVPGIHNKVFSASDLWNIQRHITERVQRKFLL